MNRWLEALLDLVYPLPADPVAPEPLAEPFCRRCGEPFPAGPEEEIVCTNCRGQKWWMECARAPYRAVGPVREAVHGFKYRGQFHQLAPLSKWLEEGYGRFYARAEEPWQAVVPVPLHPQKERQREFNQAHELARMLARRTGLELFPALERVKATASQARLRRSERLKNLQGAFRLKRGFDAKGMRLLLVDDVLTTGATVNACARVLMEAGAVRVAALTVARG